MDSVGKVCLIQPVLKIKNSSKNSDLIKMARTLFFRNVLSKFIENTYKKLIKKKITFLTKISFLSFMFFLSLFNHRQRSQSNQDMFYLAMFSYFAVHSLQAVAMFISMFSEIKENQSFTPQVPRLCYFL